jgi:hypothetical protein
MAAACVRGLNYIHWLRVTDKYILIFLSTEEYNSLYSLVLRSSVISSVNQGIYPIFLSYTTKFVDCNQ